MIHFRKQIFIKNTGKIVSRIAEIQKNSYTKKEGVVFCRWGKEHVEKVR